MNWTSFLIGLAIGLWIAAVVLIWRQPEHTQPYIVVSGSPTTTQSAGKTLWVPSGGGVYRCTNNDHGGGIVEDHGRGVVEDHGRGVVEDHGGGNVENGSAHVPAPPDGRAYHQFWCDLNQFGGPVVKHIDGRVVTVAMPIAGGYTCARDPSGNAVVVNAAGEFFEIDHGGGKVEDHGGGIVEDSGATTTNSTASDLLTGSEDPSQLSGTDRVYCAVLGGTSAPIVVDVDGEPVPEAP